MKTTFPAALSAVLLSAAVAWGSEPRPTQAPEAKQLSAADRQFITDATVGGLAEVAMGKLARANGQSPGVKDFGQRLIDDHGKANDELGTIARTLGVEAPMTTDAEHQQHLDMLGKLKGAEFDRVFARHMVDGHRKMIAMFRTEAADGRSAALRNFAKGMLPTLEQHLALAEGVSRPKT